MNKELNWKEISWKDVLKDITQNKETLNIPTDMPTQEHMKKAMQSYIEAINNKNPEAMHNLFADNVRGEDPIGTKPRLTTKGSKTETPKEDDLQYIPIKAELISPISTSYGNSAAMAFKLYMDVGGQVVTIDIIDVMQFDESGKIIEIMAHWGRENVTLINR
ncbi:steroid delta-isomerase [Paenibacillus illinoisensis]|uniref:nuclear transport factor 2 family protein n=1 Tax=Paenibacillus illinoisensis TaxID=59845 RepID=UPI003CE816E7